MTARPCRTWPAALTLLALLALVVVDSASAQDRRRNDADRVGPPQQDGARRRPPRDGPRRDDPRQNRRGFDREARLPRFLAESLPVRPSAADRGPLQPGEERELLQFARRNVPKVAQLLNGVRRRDPAAFERKLQEVAPRLRHLRRVFEYDEELGRMVVQHTDNMQRINRAVRIWHADRKNRPVDRRRIAEAVRGWVAENLRIEARIVERNADDLESRRDAIIAERTGALADPDYDLMAEPLEIRAAAEALVDAADADERSACAAQLEDLVSRQLDDRITHMRNRVERIREGGGDEVDRRVHRLLDGGPDRR